MKGRPFIQSPVALVILGKFERAEKFNGHFMLLIDPKLHKTLATKAAREGRSLNAFVAEKLGE